jgi:heat shock protein HslJ
MNKTILLLFVITLVASCKTKSSSASQIAHPDMIAKWSVEYVYGIANPPTNQTLNLDLENNTIKGFAGCNSFQGDAVRDGFKISFPRVISTQMMCDISDAENIYLKALAKVDLFSISNNKLTLYDKKGTEMVRLVKMSR